MSQRPPSAPKSPGSRQGPAVGTCSRGGDEEQLRRPPVSSRHSSRADPLLNSSFCAEASPVGTSVCNEPNQRRGHASCSWCRPCRGEDGAHSPSTKLAAPGTAFLHVRASSGSPNAPWQVERRKEKQPVAPLSQRSSVLFPSPQGLGTCLRMCNGSRAQRLQRCCLDTVGKRLCKMNAQLPLLLGLET